MDPLRIHAYKIHAIKKHKRQQFVGTLLLYFLSTLSCTLFCSSPLWYPTFCAAFDAVFFLAIPKMCSFFVTTKVLFIVGNLIVIFLVGQSKFISTKSKANSGSNYDHKYEHSAPKPGVWSQPMKVWGVAKSSWEPHAEDRRQVEKRKEFMLKPCGREARFVEDLKWEEEEILTAELLNKLADDFIARINRQRRLEVEFSTKVEGVECN